MGKRSHSTTGCEPVGAVQGAEAADQGDSGNGGRIDGHTDVSVEITAAISLIGWRVRISGTGQWNPMLRDPVTGDAGSSHERGSGRWMVFLVQVE